MLNFRSYVPVLAMLFGLESQEAQSSKGDYVKLDDSENSREATNARSCIDAMKITDTSGLSKIYVKCDISKKFSQMLTRVNAMLAKAMGLNDGGRESLIPAFHRDNNGYDMRPLVATTDATVTH